MPTGAARGMSEEATHRHPVPAADRPAARASVFDDYQWWNERDVLTQVTPARLAYLRRVAGALEGARALDLGCGGGMLAEPLARAGARVTGIDVSFNALAAARDHARQSALGIGYLRSLGEELPFRDGAFDLVVAFDVLEHLDDFPMAMEEIGRVLRPGGRFVYDTMNRTLLCRVAVIWIGEWLWPGGPPKGTHQFEKLIRPTELMGLMAANGIANRETWGFAPRGVDRRGRLIMGHVPFNSFSYLGFGDKLG